VPTAELEKYNVSVQHRKPIRSIMNTLLRKFNSHKTEDAIGYINELSYRAFFDDQGKAKSSILLKDIEQIEREYNKFLDTNDPNAQQVDRLIPNLFIEYLEVGKYLVTLKVLVNRCTTDSGRLRATFLNYITMDDRTKLAMKHEYWHTIDDPVTRLMKGAFEIVEEKGSSNLFEVQI
jgi:hypothetical protein